MFLRLIFFFLALFFLNILIAQNDLQNGYYTNTSRKLVVRKIHVLKVKNDSIEYFTMVNYKGICMMSFELLEKQYHKWNLYHDSTALYSTRSFKINYAKNEMFLSDSLKWVFIAEKKQIRINHLKNKKFKFNKKLTEKIECACRDDYDLFLNPKD